MYRIIVCCALLFSTFNVQAFAEIKPPMLPSIGFEENVGQMSDVNGQKIPDVLYKATFNDMSVYITKQGLTYVFSDQKPKSENKELNSPEHIGARNKNDYEFSVEMAWINMVLKDAHINTANIFPEGNNGERYTYFSSSAPGGITSNGKYYKIIIKEIYAGIDWVIYCNQKAGIKYDFIVHPGADPSQITLMYHSGMPLELNADGSLTLNTELGILKENAPFSYLTPSEKLIGSHFNLRRVDSHTTEVTIQIDYQEALNDTLVIDPQLTWSTYFGSGGIQVPHSTTADNSGNLFVTGHAANGGLPLLNSGTYFSNVVIAGDMFISKFSPAGVLLWSTYYGGNDADAGYSIKADNAGNIFICGETFSPNFPTLNSGTYYDGTFNGFRDPVMLKFSNTGVLQWATYFGGTDTFDDYVYDIDVDASGNVFFHGSTDASNFPLLNSGTYYDGTMNGTTQSVAGKFSNTGTLLWSTFLGGSGDELGQGITVDGNNRVYVCGNSSSSDFPTMNSGGYFSGTLSGTHDAYLTLFDNTGNLLWSTFYGGSGPAPAQTYEDNAVCIVTDANDNLFVFGGTYSTNLPTLNSGTYYDGSYNGLVNTVTVFGGDAFLLKFNPTQTLVWGTYFGGSDIEKLSDLPRGDNLAVDACGNLYVTFGTMSNDIPLMNPGVCSYFNGTYSGIGSPFFGDQVLVKFSNVGQLIWSTYLGLDAFYVRASPCVETYNNILYAILNNGFAGTGSNIPVVNPGGGAYFDGTSGGGDEIIIQRFEDTLAATVSISPPATCTCTGSATVNVTCGTAPYSYQWSANAGNQTTQTATGLCPGADSVIVTDSGCPILSATLYFNVTPTTGLALSTTQTNSTCSSATGSATAVPSGGISPYTYVWSNSQTTSTATGLAAGTYTVTVTDSIGCSGTITVTITNGNTPVLTIASQSNPLCNGDSTGSATAGVTGGAAPFTYVWSNSQTNATATGLNAGTYSVTVTDANGCTSMQTLVITDPASISIAASVTPDTCAMSNGTAVLTLSGGTAPYSYSWSTGATTQAISNLSAGAYSVVVTDGNGCTQTQTVNVQPTGSSVASVSGNVTIQLGSNATLVASGGGSYLWTDGSTSASILVSPIVTTTYCVEVNNSNCVDTACVTVFVEVPCNGTLLDQLMPNAFSPNNDGNNDQFCIPDNLCIVSFSLVVYDRLGEIVFETDNVANCWDGTYKGEELNTAVFAYYFQAELSNGDSYMQEGNLSLIK